MTKLRLYNGEEVVEKGRTKKINVQELREEVKREGMSGISTRFIMKALITPSPSPAGASTDQRTRSVDQHGQRSGPPRRYA